MQTQREPFVVSTGALRRTVGLELITTRDFNTRQSEVRVEVVEPLDFGDAVAPVEAAVWVVVWVGDWNHSTVDELPACVRSAFDRTRLALETGSTG